MKIEEDMAYIDFYRRQYWNELRFNTRKYDDESIDFKMPPFSLFRQFGGVLPPANGYNFTNSYTVKNDAYNTKSSEEEEESDGLRVSSKKSYDQGTGSDPWSAKSRVEETSYEVSQKEFEKLLEQAQDESFWETLDEFNTDIRESTT